MPITAELRLQKCYYEVVPAGVKVRQAPSLDAPTLGYRRQKMVCECDAEQGGWVRLAERLELGLEGWMLIDGAALGLGQLLKRVPASARLREDQVVRGSDPMNAATPWEAKLQADAAKHAARRTPDATREALEIENWAEDID